MSGLQGVECFFFIQCFFFIECFVVCFILFNRFHAQFNKVTRYSLTCIDVCRAWLIMLYCYMFLVRSSDRLSKNKLVPWIRFIPGSKTFLGWDRSFF